MNKFLLYFPILIAINAQAQSIPKTRFPKVTDNSFIAPEDMRALQNGCDSALRACHQSEDIPRLYSLPQAKAVKLAFYVESNEDSLIAFLAQKPSPELLMSRFRHCLKAEPSQDHLLLIEKKYKNGRAEISYRYYYSANDIIHWIIKSREPQPARKGDWLYQKMEGLGAKPFRYVECWQLEEDWESKALPSRYAALAQLSACMVDSGIDIFPNSRAMYVKNVPQTTLNDWLKLHIGEYLEIEDMTEKTRDSIWNLSAFRPELLKWADLTAKLAIETRSGSDALEFFLEPAGNPQQMLRMKRLLPVFIGCGLGIDTDNRLREVAFWAAKAHDWPVFIRAMMDMVDSRYVWNGKDEVWDEGGRVTFAKELEALSVPVMDILLGSLLMGTGNLKGRIWIWPEKIGRVMTESGDRKMAETMLISMMKDPDLDDINKLNAFAVFRAYCLSQPKKKSAKPIVHRLSGDLTQMPEILKNPIKNLVEEIHKYGIAAD